MPDGNLETAHAPPSRQLAGRRSEVSRHRPLLCCPTHFPKEDPHHHPDVHGRSNTGGISLSVWADSFIVSCDMFSPTAGTPLQALPKTWEVAY